MYRRLHILLQTEESDTDSGVAGHWRYLRTANVGIVGAGLAGLRCAEILLSEGVKVTVLEGRSRVGGRVRSRAVWAWPLAEVFADTPGQPEWSNYRHVRGQNLCLEVLINVLLGDLTGFMEQITIH